MKLLRMGSLITFLVVSLAAGLAGAHEIFVPAAVQADGAGHFSYEVTVTITAPVEFEFAYVNGLDNTDVGETWFDGFCLEVIAPGVYPWPIEGNLADTGLDGSVMFEHSMCDGWTGSGTTVILAPPVGSGSVNWSAVRGLYR